MARSGSLVLSDPSARLRLPLSWDPVRYGSRYCAPACGRGCTWAEYQAAKRAGTRLARRLGIGWRVQVWENMGWHYSVERGPVTVREYRGHRLGSQYNCAVDGWPFSGEESIYAETPQEAVRQMAARVARRLAEWSKIARQVAAAGRLR